MTLSLENSQSPSSSTTTTMTTSSSGSSEVLLLEGFIKYRDNKKWKSRWAVITKLSPIADCLQIIFYKNFKEKIKSMAPKTVLDVEHYLGIESGFIFDKESNTMAIICVKQTIVLAFETREILLQWQTKLQDHFCKERHFSVHVVNVPSKNNKVICCGPARLLLQDSLFCLVSDVPPRLNFYWSIKQLRRFGIIDGKFCFEGGSHCGKGAGLHVLYTSQPEELSKDFELASNGQLNMLNKQNNGLDHNSLEHIVHKPQLSVTSSDSSTGDSCSQMLSTFEMDSFSSNYYINSNDTKNEHYHSSINLNHNLHLNCSESNSNVTYQMMKPQTRSNTSMNGKCSFSSNTISRFTNIKPTKLIECHHHRQQNNRLPVCRHTSSIVGTSRPTVKHSMTATTIVAKQNKFINCDHEPSSSLSFSPNETTNGTFSGPHGANSNNLGSMICLNSNEQCNLSTKACYEYNHNYSTQNFNQTDGNDIHQLNISPRSHTENIDQNGQVPNGKAMDHAYQKIQKKTNQQRIALENYDVPRNLCIPNKTDCLEGTLLMNHCIHCDNGKLLCYNHNGEQNDDGNIHQTTKTSNIMDLDIKICSNKNNSSASGSSHHQCSKNSFNDDGNCFPNGTTPILIHSGTCGLERNNNNNGYDLDINRDECYLSNREDEEAEKLPMRMTGQQINEFNHKTTTTTTTNYENMYFINTMQLYENMRFARKDPKSIVLIKEKIVPTPPSDQMNGLENETCQKVKFESNNNSVLVRNSQPIEQENGLLLSASSSLENAFVINNENNNNIQNNEQQQQQQPESSKNLSTLPNNLEAIHFVNSEESYQLLAFKPSLSINDCPNTDRRIETEDAACTKTLKPEQSEHSNMVQNVSSELFDSKITESLEKCGNHHNDQHHDQTHTTGCNRMESCKRQPTNVVVETDNNNLDFCLDPMGPDSAKCNGHVDCEPNATNENKSGMENLIRHSVQNQEFTYCRSIISEKSHSINDVTNLNLKYNSSEPQNAQHQHTNCRQSLTKSFLFNSDGFLNKTPNTFSR